MVSSTSALATVQAGAEWLSLILAMCGAAMILYGVVACVGQIVRALEPRGRFSTAAARLELARYLSIGLEFQLAGDIIESSVVPTWTKIGHLAAIAAIRTGLNYFLSRDMAEDRRLIEARGQVDQSRGDVAKR